MSILNKIITNNVQQNVPLKTNPQYYSFFIRNFTVQVVDLQIFISLLCCYRKKINKKRNDKLTTCILMAYVYLCS